MPPGQYVQGGAGAGQWVDGKWIAYGAGEFTILTYFFKFTIFEIYR